MHHPTSMHLNTTCRNVLSTSVQLSVWPEQKTRGLTLRSLKRIAHHLFPFSACLLKNNFCIWCLTLHSRAYREQAGCTKASDALEHCVTLAVAAVVNVDLESWQLLRVQLVLSFSPDIRGLDNAWSLRQELNLPVCRSQINKTGKQWRESAALLIWFGCRMFSAFHTQVILGIFFSGWKGESRLHSRSVCVPVCTWLRRFVCVTV